MPSVDATSPPQASEKSGIHVSDLTWCDEVMYLATNDSRVYTHDLRSGELRQLGDGVQATALAVDWIARRLYWSSPKQQLVGATRASEAAARCGG